MANKYIQEYPETNPWCDDWEPGEKEKEIKPEEDKWWETVD